MVGSRVFTEHDRAQPCGAFANVSIGLGGFWFDSVVVDRAIYQPGNVLLNEGNYNSCVNPPPPPHSPSHTHIVSRQFAGS
jgi:hypothetical protein